jgi:hypothetical protein
MGAACGYVQSGGARPRPLVSSDGGSQRDDAACGIGDAGERNEFGANAAAAELAPANPGSFL